MPDRLKITQNAQFYTAKAEEISDISILAILDAAIQNKETDGELYVDVFRQPITVLEPRLSCIYSAKVFSTTRPVYFFDEEIADRVYAYIVIIEINNYVSVLKKSCSNISDVIDLHFDSVDHSKLTATFDDDDVEYQKIALRNMTISERAMRARSYEAMDLKGLFSTHAAGRSIPFFMKVRQGNSLKTISANSGRLVEASDRKSLNDIAIWVGNQIKSFENPALNKTFLDSFAKLVKLGDVLAKANPTAILIESYILYDRITRDQIQLLYKTKKGKTFTLPKRLHETLFINLEAVFDIDHDLKIIGHENSSKLRKNDKSITFHSMPLKRIRLVENGKEITLQKFILKNGFFSVCFDDPKYMYFMGRCFEDASGISEIDSILEILEPKSELNTVTSEKGNFDAESTAFSDNSIFCAIEAVHSADDYIFCDDLGEEWADHISLNRRESCITFLHSKYGDISTSASNLHEVVGQAIKNLGNMLFSQDQIKKKILNKFSATYNLSGVQTNINRIRKGDCTAIDEYLKDLLHDYKLHRKCVLACSFLSKADVITEFNNIKNGNKVRGNVTQLLWIISSFAHAAKDANIIPIIYCRD